MKLILRAGVVLIAYYSFIVEKLFKSLKWEGIVIDLVR